MSCYVVIRRARAGDEEARALLLRDCTHEFFCAAFLMFFFHEVTLQALVLCGAVLFIFCGASPAACACVAPVAAAAVAAAVWSAHAAAAARGRAAARAELAGWVAEARGSSAALLRPPRAVRIYTEEQARRLDHEHDASLIVGTVTLAEWRGDERRGLVRGLAVRGAWRRRGAARALAGGAARAAAAAGLAGLEAVLSAPQAAAGARAALHAAGWSLRASYERLLAPALTLPMLQLARDLPAA